MRSDRLVPKLVDAQFGELTPYAFPEGSCEFGLSGVVVVVVDVDVEAAADAVVERRGEFAV